MEKASIHSLRADLRRRLCLEPQQFSVCSFTEGPGVPLGEVGKLPIHVFAISYNFPGKQPLHSRKDSGLVIGSLGFDMR